MYKLKSLFVLVGLSFLLFSCGDINQNKKDEGNTNRVISTSKEALEELKSGNERFLLGKLKNTNYAKQIETTKEEQKPHSIILTCMDSRVPPEIIFDQGIGNIFVVRNAGNIEDENILGSMEYSVKFSIAKLIVVMGHSHCGAVKGAIKDVDAGNLTQLLNQIKPYIPTDKKHPDLVDETAKSSLKNTISDILKQSEIIRELVESNQIRVIGAFYNIESGKVTFYD